MRFERKQVLPVKGRGALRHLISWPSTQRVGERRLARAIGPHDRVDLARIDGERQPLEDRGFADRGVEVFNLEHCHSVLSLSLEGRRDCCSEADHSLASGPRLRSMQNASTLSV